MDKTSTTNLQIQLTSFIGRREELTLVKGMLDPSRLITLTGVGGCGKTRLAIQVAYSMVETYADGVWLIDLVPVQDPAQIPQHIAQSLGVRASVDEPLLDTLERFLASKHLLLVLDNCEHLRKACASVSHRLLSKAPGLHILATSRELLGVVGEVIFPMPGLGYPEKISEPVPNGQDLDVEKLLRYDAIRLFVERARSNIPGFRLTAENAQSIVEICQRVDGLPLALELVSAWVNILTTKEIAERLSGNPNNRFALHLSGPRSGLDSRHDTLHSTIDWSYALLSPAEQILLRRLAIFQGGFTLESAEAICMHGDRSGITVLEGISLLVRKSLVVSDTLSGTRARYRLLETIRDYALEKLELAGELSDLRDRHLHYFLKSAEESAPKLYEAYQQFWLNWLESEHDNLRASLAWALESGGVAAGLRTALALGHFWGVRGYLEEGLTWFQRLFAIAENRISLEMRVNALVYMSYLAMSLGNAQASQAYGLEAVRAAETSAVTDRALLALASHSLGTSAIAAGDFQTAYATLDQAIPIYRDAGPSHYYRMALYLQGETAVQLRYDDIALERLQESLALTQQDGDLVHVSDIYNALGDLARLKQHYAEAAIHYKNSASLSRQLGLDNNLASALGNIGFTNLHFGRVESALGCFRECMAICQAQRNKQGMVECLAGFAGFAIVSGQYAAGIRLLAAASAISGLPSVSRWKATQMEVEQYRTLARTNLTQKVLQAEQSAGRAMSLEQAVACALGLSDHRALTTKDRTVRTNLTQREREIAALIGQGMTNGEIAAKLVISKRTVETHVNNILSKLEFSHRVQIMRMVLDDELIVRE